MYTQFNIEWDADAALERPQKFNVFSRSVTDFIIQTHKMHAHNLTNNKK